MGPSPSLLPYPSLAYQPLSTIYRLYRLTTVLLRLPLWLAKALFPALRPRRTWTFRQALARTLVYHLVHTQATLGITQPLSLAPGREGARWTTIAPPPPDEQPQLYTGPLASTTTRPAVVGATWYGTPAAAAPRGPDDVRAWTRVALHLHGGAFVTGDGRRAATGFLCDTLARRAGFDAVLAPQYRLAGYGGRDPFPAALQDCLTAYLYLVRGLGLAPSRITVSGDSAGGNLALALLRYLETFGPGLGGGGGLGGPGAVVLLSPWLHPSAALHDTGHEASALMRTDYLPSSFLLWGANAYIRQAAAADGGEGEGEGITEWVDPLRRPFVTRVPVFVSWAEGEILSVDCAAWAAEMREKGPVGWRFETSVEGGGAPHDTLLAGNVLGWKESAEEVARRIGKFVEGG